MEPPARFGQNETAVRTLARALAKALAKQPARWLSMTGALLAAAVAMVESLFQVGSIGVGRLTLVLAVALGVGHLVVRTLDRVVSERGERWVPEPLHREVSRQVEQARRDLLDEVRHRVDSELEAAFDSLDRLDLRLVERPDAVEQQRRPGEPAEQHRAVAGHGVHAVFVRLRRQMLVLGEPGSGKTTLLMELAGALVAEAAGDPWLPVPVLFRLPSWAAEQRPLANWLVEVLDREYGVASWLAAQWVHSDHIVPLLDGLDEVPAATREACVAAINRFHRAHGQLPMAVCSRFTEYDLLQTRLQLRGAVVIQPLTDEVVHGCLARAGPRLAGVRAVLGEDEQLRELLATPLLLGIAARTYLDEPPSALRASGTLATRRHRLLADFVGAMLRRRRATTAPPPYTSVEVRAGLGWLAGVLQGGGSVFYLDRIRAHLLPTTAERWVAAWGVGVAAGVTAALLGFAVVLIVLWLAGVASPDAGRPGPGVLLPRAGAGAVVAIGVGLALAVSVHRPELRPLRWSWAAWRRTLPWSLIGGAAAGLLLAASAIAFRPELRTPAFVVALVADGLFIGLGLALWRSLLAGFELPVDLRPRWPGDDVRRHGRNALIGALVGALTVGPGVGLSVALALEPFLGGDSVALGVVASLMTVVFTGLLTALRRGGAAYLQHHLVRRLLARSAGVPRDLAAFLEHAAWLNLLRQHDGGYEFAHPVLRQFFGER